MKDLIMFEKSVIRRAWHNDEWFFVIQDIVQALTESKDVKQYVRRMRKRDEALNKGWVQIVHPLSIETAGGKQKMNCANTEGILRIIQSVPSPKAEPFKLWLAKVGYQRIQEIENPDLVIERIRETYKIKGYSDEWIDTRLQSIGVRKRLTDEWKERGVKEGIEYAILTAEMSQVIFGLKPADHKKYKGLKRQSLRDHMTEEELIFTMLGEVGTRKEAKQSNAVGFLENKKAARKGGEAAKDALNAYENKTGRKVLSEKNFLKQIRDKVKRKIENKGDE